MITFLAGALFGITTLLIVAALTIINEANKNERTDR